MAIAEIKVWPVGTNDPSISSYIREAFEIADKNEDIEAVLTPTSTVLEGELPTLLSVAVPCIKHLLIGVARAL